MSEELRKKLPDGVAVVFFENLGNFVIFGDLHFEPDSSAGYFAVGYTCSKIPNEPSKKARKEHLHGQQKQWATLCLNLTLINKEIERFHLFGTKKELEQFQEELKSTFESGEPLVIKTSASNRDHLPSWWYER